MAVMRYSIEVLPHQVDDFCTKHSAFASKLDREHMRVFVPHIQGMPYQQVADSAITLLDKGFRAVPHLAVRNLQHGDDVQAILDRFDAVGIDSLLLLGGDGSHPQRFGSVMDFLDSDMLSTSASKELFFGGFSDGHPHLMDKDQALCVLTQKCQWARDHGHNAHVVSQICFDRNSLVRFIAELHNNIRVPFSIGFVGPTNISKMLKIVKMIGLPKAMEFANKNNMFKLINRWQVDAFVRPLIQQGQVDGLHIYPFGNYTGAMKKLVEFLDIATSYQALVADR